MDEPKKEEWKTTERVLQRREMEKESSADLSNVLHSTTSDPTNAGAPAKPEGIIAGYKANQIQRKAALQQMDVWYSTQLDIARHRLSEVAKVKKAQTTVIAEQFLRNLDQQHLEYLTNLGLKNVNARSEALLKLGDQTAETLRQLESKEWPQMLLDQAVDGVVTLHRRFFEKIMEELGQEER